MTSSLAANCLTKSLDLVFMLDGSKSVKKDEFESVKSWVVRIAKMIDIKSKQNQIGVIQYSHFYQKSVVTILWVAMVTRCHTEC